MKTRDLLFRYLLPCCFASLVATGVYGKTIGNLSRESFKVHEERVASVDGTAENSDLVVTTDTRYARGATMAFARMTVKGTGIKERGICWSEKSEPTVEDSHTTQYLENNGRIYRLDGLTPATMYYMRAYAIDTNGNVAYGNVIKFCTIPQGSISYTIRDGGDADAMARITSAVKTAVNYWNNLTSISNLTLSVGYDSGVPTAECSYGGWMSVGSNSSYQATGTILHEMLHAVGVIPWADTEWSRHNLRSSVRSDGYGTGYWLGDRVTEVLRFWDNSTTERLNGDYQHMWPYGINGSFEDTGKETLYLGNGLICQALGEDGLQQTSESFARPYYSFTHQDGQKYYIMSETDNDGAYGLYLIPDEKGNIVWRTMKAEDVVKNDSTAWYMSFSPQSQYYQLRNVATGDYVSYSKSGSNGIKMTSVAAPSDAEDFQLMKGRVDIVMGKTNTQKRGYWIVHPASNWSPQCLQLDDNGVTEAATFNIANGATNQRWTILTQDEVACMEQDAITGLKDEVEDASSSLRKLVDTPHVEDIAGTDEQVNQKISQIAKAVDNLVVPQEAQQLIAEVKKATTDFLKGVTPSDASHPFDLTYMLSNPGMDAADGWSTAPTLSYSCGEFYEKRAYFDQTVSNLPAGTYQFCANAFQRPGSYSEVYEPYLNGTDNITAKLSAGTEKVNLCNICKDAQTQKLGGSEVEVTSGLYVPNNMEAASYYFAKGLYENKVTTVLNENGSSLKVGLIISSAPSKYWCIFDNFRLLFFGRMSKDAVTGIKKPIVSTYRNGKVFTIDGRYIGQDKRLEDLPKGIYIVDGKKYVKTR